MRALLALLLYASPLAASHASPWLGNLYEFEGSVKQERHQSSHLDTQDGIHTKHLHNNLTSLALGFMPMEALGVHAQVDLSETQKRFFGFDALKGKGSFQWLNDLVDDQVSLTTSLAASISPKSRVHDLSSLNHGHVEGEFDVAIGKEFGYGDKSFWRTWACGYAGVANRGSPWLGGELHLDKVVDEAHHFGALIKAEKGFSTHSLREGKDFTTWAQVDYSFEEVGVEYCYTHYSLATCRVKLCKRIHACNCPSGVWSVLLSIDIPFSPW